MLGGLGFANFFRSLVLATKNLDLVVRSPRGQIVKETLDYISNLETGCLTSISVTLTTELNACLLASKKYILPSVALGAVWSSFHKIRSSHTIIQAWSTFVTTNIPSTHCKEDQLCLQLLLDSMIHKMIANSAEAAKREVQSQERAVSPLTVLESNAVRYMAGYLATKLLKKYRKRSKNPAVRLKRKLFVRTLEGMKAEQQPGEPDSVLEYTTLWTELIDRGGLYHISDCVFSFTQSLEMLVRKHLNVQDIQTYIPGTDLRKVIIDKLLLSENIITLWEDIAQNIPSHYEKYSVELLKNVANLWITIRGNSFARGWTSKFVRKYTRGTRKTLQTDKEDKKK